jgi:plasmid replication initiation protein
VTSRRYVDSQFDLFIFNVTDFQLRDQRETMERPFFSLAKRKRIKPIEYENDGVWVKVEPHQNYGMATIWDADVMIWAASALVSMKNKGINDIPDELHFQPFDLLKAIHRQTGGDQYHRLREALDRLKSTVIRTNIRAPRGKKEAVFSWISEWTDLVDERTNESRGMTIVLSQWFKQGVLQRGGVLAIDPAYFSITGGRERWLYRVARKHAGGNGPAGFAISLPTLFEKSGAEGPFRRFKFEIQKIAERNDLPGLLLRVERTAGGEAALRMIVREEAGEEDLPAPPGRPARLRQQGVPKPERQRPVVPLPLFPVHLSEETISRVRRDFPGWDVYALKAEFDAWLAEDDGRRPDNYQIAFYGFVKRHHELNRYANRPS